MTFYCLGFYYLIIQRQKNMTARAFLFKLQLQFILAALIFRVKKSSIFIYFCSPTGSFFAVAFGQPRWTLSDLLIYPFSIKSSIHCMILTCSWADFQDKQPGDIRPDFLFPRAYFSLQVLGEQQPIMCSRWSDGQTCQECCSADKDFHSGSRTLSWIEHLSLSAPVQSNKSPWPCAAGMKIRRQDRLRCGNSLNACSSFFLQLHITSSFLNFQLIVSRQSPKKPSLAKLACS